MSIARGSKTNNFADQEHSESSIKQFKYSPMSKKGQQITCRPQAQGSHSGLFYFETRFLGVSKFLILKPGFYRVSTKQIRDGNQSAQQRIQCPLQLRLLCVHDELSVRSGTLAIIYVSAFRNNRKR